VLFEVPTGIVADTVGRRASYLLGTLTLTVTTLLYVWLWELHAAIVRSGEPAAPCPPPSPVISTPGSIADVMMTAPVTDRQP
jgi:hypothetical protein